MLHATEPAGTWTAGGLAVGWQWAGSVQAAGWEVPVREVSGYPSGACAAWGQWVSGRDSRLGHSSRRGPRGRSRGGSRYLVPERLLGKVPRTLGLGEGMSPPGAQRGGAAAK